MVPLRNIVFPGFKIVFRNIKSKKEVNENIVPYEKRVEKLALTCLFLLHNQDKL